MGTNLNFKGSANEPPGDPGGSGRPLGNFFLSRQPSVYSLTFDEFQNSLGKDFGSMNMDELLKSIWSAEENQNMASAATATGSSVNGVVSGQELGNLQRQGSLTLPRTLSTMTVDEVWKDISKEYGVSGKDVGTGSDMPSNQRQLTLGEITLEEFLVRAGVVREDTQMPEKPNNNNNNNGGGFLGDLVRSSNNNVAAAINFQQPNHGVGLMGGQVLDNNNQISLQSPNLPLNVNGVRSSGQQSMAAQLPQQPTQQPLHQQSPHHPTIYPKQATVAYPPPPMAIPSSAHLGSPRIRGGMMGLTVTDPTTNGGMAHGSALQGGGMGLVGMGGGATGVASGSPANLSSDGLSKSNGDTASVSPVPYMFSGGLRGRKSNNAVEKVIERRQRRMIKNRESAARSRARKQAYTMELEQEVAKLKEENQELRKKQAEIMEMQKNQALEMLNEQPGAKKRCLRRTQTGPW